jgi:phosphatidylinositol kinase/protein kinase (PI-3  family)
MQVVPFTPDSGVVGWVENTLPLMGYLRDAHRRYARKGDLTTDKAALMMRTARMEGAKQRERCAAPSPLNHD